MKKIIIILLASSVLLAITALWPQIAQAGATFTFNPTSAKVGEKVQISISVTNIPEGTEKIELVIFDAPPHEDLDYRKLYFEANASQPFKYTWDTETAESAVGPHRVVVYANKTVNGELKRGQNLGETTYTLLSASSGDTETPPTDDSGGSSTAFDLGPLGRVTFLPTKVDNLQELLGTIIIWFLNILGAIAVISIIYSGIMYITAGPDTAKAESAKKNLAWAIVGIVIILLAVLIINFVINALTG